ncbi:MAG: protein kinase [Planctomycetes bacterium]|nr:protein kinase [Planctomycetota bacterium]MBU4400660.1 protein kinase [Planctomycetota bacterium]MCG2682386.1 protein kinase [Planctomycetales bacterium]
MAYQTAEQVAERAFDMGLLDERQLRDVWGSFGSHNVPMEDFLQILVRREYLTNYQVERLVKGERTGFFFGNYRVLYLVGSGTFARVYRAVHRETDQVVAVKVLRNRYSENRAQAGLFVREGRVGCALRHPNIVPTYEVVSERKTHFLVMEFIEGRNLREFVRIRKKLDPLEATEMMAGIADGMRYAFEKGLTHRDLKMSNVLVSSRGEAKIVDFGLASMDEALSDDAIADLPNTRTVDYAALERATGVRKDDVRSDIYFLGCMYYHMLTGRPPLTETRDRLLRLSKQRFLDVVPIQKADPSLPACVTIVVNKAMALDPSLRYQSPLAMYTDLRTAAKRLSAGATESEEAEETGKPAVHRRRPTALAVPDTGRSVMVVESDAQMQDLFRRSFKQAGYRVLVTVDPARAAGRFRQDASVADCVLFNAQQIGKNALKMFNELGEDERTKAVPAVLLLDESQHKWKSQAQTNRHRIVLPMPITMGQLRAALEQLLPAGAKAAHGRT